MARKSVRSYVVCPKCKTAKLQLDEVTEAFEIWYQDSEGNITDDGETGAFLDESKKHIRATCSNKTCNHSWTVRGVKSITELPNWDEEVEERDAFETNEEEISESEDENIEEEEIEETEENEKIYEAEEEQNEENTTELYEEIEGMAEESSPPPAETKKKEDKKKNKGKNKNKNKNKRAA